MSQNEIEIGRDYVMVHHDGLPIVVRILGTLKHTSRSGFPWNESIRTLQRYRGINLKTGREIVVKSAAKLRRLAGADDYHGMKGTN